LLVNVCVTYVASVTYRFFRANFFFIGEAVGIEGVLCREFLQGIFIKVGDPVGAHFYDYEKTISVSLKIANR
jgi:hypothetical protein